VNQADQPYRLRPVHSHREGRLRQPLRPVHSHREGQLRPATQTRTQSQTPVRTQTQTVKQASVPALREELHSQLQQPKGKFKAFIQHHPQYNRYQHSEQRDGIQRSTTPSRSSGSSTPAYTHPQDHHHHRCSTLPPHAAAAAGHHTPAEPEAAAHPIRVAAEAPAPAVRTHQAEATAPDHHQPGLPPLHPPLPPLHQGEAHQAEDDKHNQ
jgi:hypothetical protein